MKALSALLVAALLWLALPVDVRAEAAAEVQMGVQDAAEPAAEPEGILLEGQININTAGAEQFSMLPGIDRLEAGNILEYRAANGPFNAIDDLLKVKGVRRLEYFRCKEYLTLEGETTLRTKNVLVPLEGKLNINTAAADQLTMLPGINKIEADKILAYRARNGKFAAVDDLLKVDGIRRIEYMRFRDFIVLDGPTTLKRKKILTLVKGMLNINTATLDEFAMLPGIDRLEAGNIIEYRTKNGPFNAIDDLLKVKGVRRLEYFRCKEYLTLEGKTTLERRFR